MDKFFNIGVDIKNERIKVLEGIFTGDGVRMRLTLSDNGKRIDFTGAQIIRLTVRKGDYKTVETVELLKEIQAAEAENGIIEIILPESFVSDKGMHQLQAALIGADGQILDSEVPVRQILEQLVAKTGLPPFLLGLNWSTTERMSTQQADLLTSELWALRRTVEPAMRKICQTYLALEGLDNRVEIEWDDISLQDITQEAQAALYRAQAEKLTAEQEETT